MSRFQLEVSAIGHKKNVPAASFFNPTIFFLQTKKVDTQQIEDIDVDKSGAIDYEEFIQAHYEWHQNGSANGEHRQAMDMEDTNIARQMFRVFDMASWPVKWARKKKFRKQY